MNGRVLPITSNVNQNGVTSDQRIILERMEKEDQLREDECSRCRFIPCCKPKEFDKNGNRIHGVSALCRMAPCCPHSRKNIFFHSRFFYESLGELGFHWLDYHRNFFFGFSTILSGLGVAMLLLGAIGYSENETIVKNAYWMSMSAINSTTTTGDGHIEFSAKVGLNSMVFENCLKKNVNAANKGRRRLESSNSMTDVSNYSSYIQGDETSHLRRLQVRPPPLNTCKTTVISFDDTVACSADGLFGVICQVCRESASRTGSSMLSSAIGKGLSFWSMQKRMYAFADSPSLKFLGIALELVSLISLAGAWGFFDRNCSREMRSQIDPKNYPSLTDIAFRSGPGSQGVVVGLVAAIVRALLHLLTPLPNRGMGLVVPLYRMMRRMLCCCEGCFVLYDDEEEERKHKEMIALLHHQNGLEDHLSPPAEIATEEETDAARE